MLNDAVVLPAPLQPLMTYSFLLIILKDKNTFDDQPSYRSLEGDQEYAPICDKTLPLLFRF